MNRQFLGWDVDIAGGTQNLVCLPDRGDLIEFLPSGSVYSAGAEFRDDR